MEAKQVLESGLFLRLENGFSSEISATTKAVGISSGSPQLGRAAQALFFRAMVPQHIRFFPFPL
jgi:hypothetical protein